jgi:hypothetical protein
VARELLQKLHQGDRCCCLFQVVGVRPESDRVDHDQRRLVTLDQADDMPLATWGREAITGPVVEHTGRGCGESHATTQLIGSADEFILVELGVHIEDRPLLRRPVQERLPAGYADGQRQSQDGLAGAVIPVPAGHGSLGKQVGDQPTSTWGFG